MEVQSRKKNPVRLLGRPARPKKNPAPLRPTRQREKKILSDLSAGQPDLAKAGQDFFGQKSCRQDFSNGPWNPDVNYFPCVKAQCFVCFYNSAL